MVWKDDISQGYKPSLFFRELRDNTEYCFQIEDFWNPEEVPGGSAFHADYLVFNAIVLKRYAKNSLHKGTPIRLHLPRISFTNSLRKALGRLNVEKRDGELVEISIQKMSQKCIEVLNFRLIRDA